MIETVIAFTFGVLYAWWFWPILFVAAIFFEHSDQTLWAVLSAALAGFLVYKVFGFGDLTLVGTLLTVAVYTALGFGYAVFRWIRYNDDRTERFNSDMTKFKQDFIDTKQKILDGVYGSGNFSNLYQTTGDDDPSGKLEHDVEGSYGYSELIMCYKRDTNYREKLDKLAHWVIVWPTSALAHFLKDVVALIKKTFIKFFSGLFDRISERAHGKAIVDIPED